MGFFVAVLLYSVLDPLLQTQSKLAGVDLSRIQYSPSLQPPLKELWDLGKCSINKCIVRVTPRSVYLNNYSCIQKEKAPVYFMGQQKTNIIGELSTPPVPSSYFYSDTPLPFLHLRTSSHRGSPEVCLLRTVWPSSLSLAQCKYSWSERSWRIWAIW